MIRKSAKITRGLFGVLEAVMRGIQRVALVGSIAPAAGWIGTASAAAIITKISATGPGLDSFVSLIDDDTRSLDLTKTFKQVGAITLTFTVGHSTGGGGPYDVTEAILNNTGTEFIDFHFAIVEPPQGDGVVFTSLQRGH